MDQGGNIYIHIYIYMYTKGVSRVRAGLYGLGRQLYGPGRVYRVGVGLYGSRTYIG